jgi:hypothetical protein
VESDRSLTDISSSDFINFYLSRFSQKVSNVSSTYAVEFNDGTLSEVSLPDPVIDTFDFCESV